MSPPLHSEISLHPDHRQSMRRMAVFLLILALIQLIAWLAPTMPDSKGIPHYLPLHLLLEMVSIIVAMMVFALGWNSRSSRLSGNIVVIASIFFSVGLLDFLHTLSYGGMPDFITPNDAQKHLNFWLAARLLASLGLLLIVIRPWQPLRSPHTRYLIFGSLSMGVVLLTLTVILAQPLLPDTFIPGQGLTPFKKNTEYLVILIHLVTAAILWHKMRTPQNFNVVLLFGAVTALAMSEFYFTLYTTMTGSYNVLGHLYKVVAYLFIYRALVVETIEEPYDRLMLAQRQAVEQNEVLKDQSHLLDSIVQNIPNMVFLKRASDLRFELFNKAGERLLGYDRNDLMGKNDYDFFTREQADFFVRADREVLNSHEILEIPEEAISCRDGTQKILHTFKIGLFGSDGKPTHLLGISVDITEQKQSEAALVQSQYRLSEAQRIARLGSWQLDLVNNKLDWSDEIYRIFEIDRDSFGARYEDFLDAIHPDDRAQVNEAFTESVKNRQPYHSSHRLLMKDGRIKYVVERCETAYDDRGNPIQSNGTVHDITELMQAEVSLRASEEKLRTILDNVDAYIYLKDTAGNYLFANRKVRELWHAAMDDIVGFGDDKFFDAATAENIRHNDRRVLDMGETVRELEINSLDGSEQRFTFQSTKLPLRRADGSIYALCGISVDISERVRIEEDLRRYQDHLEEVVQDRTLKLEQANSDLLEEMAKLKRTEEAMRETRERLSYALDGAEAGSFSHDMTSGLFFLDERAQMMLGIAKEKCTLSDWSALIHPDDRDAAIATLAEGFQKHADRISLEYRVGQADNNQRHLIVYAKIKYNELGEPLNSYGIIFDISKQKQFEYELRRAKESAESANRTKSLFLSNMSHELRTPLNAILGFSSLMRKDPHLIPGLRENLDIINRSGEHLLALINEILEMAKIESGWVRIACAPFDLDGMVRDVSDLMRLRAQEKGLQLRIELDAGLPRVFSSDEVRLRQVLINLVGNAVKFTQQGGVTLRFGMKPDASSSCLVIEVVDSGLGIKPEDQQRIFEPFVQLSESAVQSGTGLGLAITQQYLKLMGGTISVASTLGQGSVFRVELPVQSVATTTLVKSEQNLLGEVVGLAPGQPKYRILIVEDQLENQKLLSRLMNHLGLQVKVAQNGAQAVAIFRSWSPHLIWMDRRMPVMDGLEATRQIRALPDGKQVKIVAVTASSITEQGEELLAAGFDDFLSKPYRFTEIFACLTRQLGVEYTYAATPAADQNVPALTPEMLALLPYGLRAELRAALESLEEERISIILRKIQDHDPMLHKALSDLAGDFNYPVILNALRTL